MHSRRNMTILGVQLMVSSHYRLILKLGKEMQINHHSSKEHTKMSKIAKVWLRNVIKCGKYSLAKFENFVFVCITCGNCYHANACGNNFRTQYKSIQNLQTLQGYIFRILQHFATKLCNFTHFSMLFPEIYFFCQDKKSVYNGNCLFLHQLNQYK